jgi:hypothetical protein
MPTGYTPPSGSAVNLNFTGAYTPPAGNNVILNFFNTNAYVLTADAGSYALSGTAAAIKAGRLLRAYNNLIVNGRFTVDASGWSVAGADTTFGAVAGVGVLALGPAASGSYAYQAVAVTPGQPYTLSALLKPRNAYVLTADPGSYSLAGTAANLLLGSGGVSSDFDGQEVEELTSCAWIISNDGFTYKKTRGNTHPLTQSVAWIVPQLHMSDYECRATDTHDVRTEVTAPGTFGTWLDLASDHEWGWDTLTTGADSRFLLEIRHKLTTTILASGTIILRRL